MGFCSGELLPMALNWNEIKILFLEISRMHIFLYKAIAMTRDYFHREETWLMVLFGLCITLCILRVFTDIILNPDAQLLIRKLRF